MPEKSSVKFRHCSCCARRNSNVTAVTVNSVFIVTAFTKFMCDIPFSVSDMNKSNYEGKSLNNRYFILKCMEKYAQLKILFRDTKWLLSNKRYSGRDNRAVWACAIGRTTWPLHCQFAPWKNNEALFVFCGPRVWNLLKEWRSSMETVVWVREECMNGWKDRLRPTNISRLRLPVGKSSWPSSGTSMDLYWCTSRKRVSLWLVLDVTC
jgi:hypothetical protein